MHTIDLIIVAIYLTSIFAVGYFLRGYVNSFNDFMIANSKMGVALGVASMAGTELGLITVMYNAQKGVSGLFAAFHIGLIAFVVTLAIGLSGFVIVKLRDLKVKSIPEFYKIRYGKDIRILGALFLVFGGILNMGLFLKVGAIFLDVVFFKYSMDDISVNISVIMIFLLALVLFYTMMGGMISVIITDYMQFVILSIGLIISTFIIVDKMGGLDAVFAYVEASKGIDAFNPISSNEFGYSYIIWMFILGFVSCVVWPTSATRALAMKDSESLKKQYIWSSISFLIRFMLPCFLGILAFVYIDLNDIVINAKDITLDEPESRLRAMPTLIKEVLPVGILGLVVAGMLAAFMSTHDSYLLCWSTIIINDIVSPLSKKKLNSNQKIYLSRIVIILLGIYILYWGLFYKGSEDIWDYLSITGSVYFSGAITLIVFGVYSKFANSYGAYASLFCGLISLLGLGPLKVYFGIDLSGAVIGIITLLLSAVSMVVGSFYGNILFNQREKLV